jgi:hypothetical protein
VNGDFTEKILWNDYLYGHTIKGEVDVAVSSCKANKLLLIVPGVDGTIDGHEKKYLRIANNIKFEFHVPVVRMSNPFIHSERLDKNLRSVLEWISEKTTEIVLENKYELFAMGHSLGATNLAQVAWEYPEIKKILLINPSPKVHLRKTINGLDKFEGEVTILLGKKDQNFKEMETMINTFVGNSNFTVKVISNANHHFAGEAFNIFLNSPKEFLFNWNSNER